MLISELYALSNRFPVITTDSRVCPSGSIFFALKGDSFDGNAFAEKALQAGCAYAIIDNHDVALNMDKTTFDDDRLILVDDVLTTLQQLACLHRKTLGIPVIAITGTNGKTTTKELTAAVLSKKYNTLFTQGNLNNHIGVPLTLLRLTREHDVAVIEMGANHPGEIYNLSNIARPDYGLITNVGYAHLEGFGSFEGVIKTKGELYDFFRENGGIIFIHNDNEYLTKIARGLEWVAYGYDENLFVSGKASDNHPFLSFSWKHKNMQHDVTTQLVGDYNLQNVLAAITIGTFFDISPEQINDAIANYIPTNNRSQFKKTEHNELIIDAYNANPSSMRAALENFALSELSLPKAVILGDMRELGEKSTELHAEILQLAEKSGFEKILLCGKVFSVANKNHICFPSVEELGKFLETNPLRGYRVLIKGSHGEHLEKIIDRL